MKFAVFLRGLKLEGSNFVSLWPRRWISVEIEGQYDFRPSRWYLLNLRWHSGCLTNFISPVSETFVSWRPFRCCVHFLFSLGLSFHTLDKICKKHIWSFDLQLCASILVALCALFWHRDWGWTVKFIFLASLGVWNGVLHDQLLKEWFNLQVKPT